MIDTYAGCNGNVTDDFLAAVGSDGAMGYASEFVGGYARGDVWSQWVVGYSDGVPLGSRLGAQVQYVPNWAGVRCSPISCPSSCNAWNYAGFVLREYEYSRHETGASPYFPRFRFPGQYWDPETDLYENWHRYYIPFAGQYLSPEPMLQDGSEALS